MRLLYFDLAAGIAGDMALGALVDVGANLADIDERIRALPLGPFDLVKEAVLVDGLRGVKIRVGAESQPPHRSFADIERMLQECSSLPDRARGMAIEVFTRLAVVEARLHGRPVADVSFHEVGGVDSVVDIVGVCLAMDLLDIDAITASPVPLSRGFVGCHHGRLPLPAPATLELLVGAPVYGCELGAESVTPTGAALLSALVSGYGSIPAMTIEGIGYGAGDNSLAVPNLLRVLVGRPVAVGLAPLLSSMVAFQDPDPGPSVSEKRTFASTDALAARPL